MARRAYRIQALRASGPGLLWLDSGDLLFPRVRSPFDPLQRQQARADFVLAQHARLGLDAFCPSLSDLRRGPEALLEPAREAGLPLLAANLEGADGGPLPFTRRLVRIAGGVRVGLFGLVGPGSAPGVRVTDPLAAARRELAALRPTAELVVCLSNLGIEGDAQLAAEVEGIDFILGAGDDRMVLRPRPVGGTYLLQPYKKGEYLGLLRLSLRRPSAGWADALEIEDLERQLGRAAGRDAVELGERLAALRARNPFHAELRPLPVEEPEDPETRRAVAAELAREALLP